MLIILKGNIDWICLLIEGIVLIYLYCIYRKNKHKNSNEVIISKRNVKIIIIILIVINIIFFISKIINMLNLAL